MTRPNENKRAYYGAVIVMILFIAGPILWNILISLTPEAELMKPHSNLLPASFDTINYVRLFNSTAREHTIMLNALTNSILAAAATLALALPITIAAGYALARYDFPGKQIVENLIFFTIVIPVSSTIIPIYAVYRELNLLDNLYWTAVIYTSSVIPFAVWITTNYFKQLPKELWQAAALDGFTERQIFMRIILPLSHPAIITTVLIIFLMTWQQFMVPSILLASFDNRVITMSLSSFMTKDTIQYTLIAACGIIAIIPPALLAVWFRKYLISGLTAGSVKF
ncbi:MAG: carbohydrate ABC transporter permease [Megasphaera sp.]|jgi:multiple sugar transport system permease protein|nr:carbohydrate ABC transporter permease [Megasphaera sp.]MCH4188513.1 carbohydrate ABC transporter permease [Megasphaera sp.]MCH4218376.1 carbohydrate ABC transporter permease [Megasphaera sp.]